ncbi:MAG: hypothetical protein KFB97_14330 [Cyanobium sp. M30B3]|nr:MAG: hypothetical protein KFB97_14330 [Cyanobium sp. M30B3]
MVNRSAAAPPASPHVYGGPVALLAVALSLGGCAQPGWQRSVEALMQQGHAATVDCLQAERAITGGDELRCEEWAYVRQNYLRPKD